MPKVGSTTEILGVLPPSEPGTARHMRRGYRRGRARLGTSLIEILVVIVVFLVGILAVIQIFPGGFKLLQRTNDLSKSVALSHDLSERLKGRSDLLPDMILPVSYNDVVDPTRFSTDTSLYDELNSTLNFDGTVTHGGLNYSNFAYYSGPNVFRKIVGEGEPIPSPSQVGNYYGGLMVLQFGPTRQLSSTEQTNIQIYGNDYDVQVGPTPPTILTYGQAYIDNPNSSSGILSIQMDDVTTQPQFRLSCTIYVTVAGVVQRRDIVGLQVPNLGSPPLGTYGNGYVLVPFAQLARTGEIYQSVDPASVKVQRVYQPIPAGTAFSTTDPYQYKLLNAQLGVILFSPVGYNYFILRANGQQEPLKGRVDYEVQDWRIISDLVRMDTQEINYRLALSSLKVLNNTYEDGKKFPGLGVQVPLASGSLAPTDVVFQDVATGGILLYDPSNPQSGTPSGNDIPIDPTKSSFYVDKSLGVFRPVPIASSTLPKFVQLCLPDPTQPSGYAAPVQVNMNNRLVKVMYMARGNWSVQPLVAAARYYEHTGPLAVNGLGAGEYLVSPGTRIYFPAMDTGRKINIDLAYYRDSGGNLRTLENQSLIIRNQPQDPQGSYADLTEADGTAVAFDFSHGFAVQGIRGISVAVKVTNNPTTFQFGTDSPTTLNNFDQYRAANRSTTTETFIQRGSK